MQTTFASFAMKPPHYTIFTKYAKMLVHYERFCLLNKK
nr:MAG TPA: hypothetical protein [Caudoviricetes sp.]